MYILNIARVIKKIQSMKSATLSLKTKRIGFFKKNSYYSMKHLGKRFTVACKQVNRKCLILLILKNTINHL